MIVKMKDEKLRPLFAIVESVKQERSCWKPGDEGNSGKFQSRTQSNACARAMALALGKLTTGTPKFRGSGSLSACTIDKR